MPVGAGVVGGFRVPWMLTASVLLSVLAASLGLLIVVATPPEPVTVEQISSIDIAGRSELAVSDGRILLGGPDLSWAEGATPEHLTIRATGFYGAHSVVPGFLGDLGVAASHVSSELVFVRPGTSRLLEEVDRVNLSRSLPGPSTLGVDEIASGAAMLAVAANNVATESGYVFLIQWEQGPRVASTFLMEG